MKLATVIILSWNSLPWLRKFLPEIIRHTSSPAAEILIADNASSDGTVEWLKENHPELAVRIFGKNLGYAGGYQTVLEDIETTYAVLLNSDVEVTSGWIENLTRFMEQHPDAGAAAPKILSFGDKGSFEYAGAAGGWIDRYGYPFCRGRIFSAIEQDKGQFDKPEQIFWASGACLMLRMEAYRQAGGLDPAFFAHMEEIDLCWRIQTAGWSVWYVPDSTVYHVGGGALPNESPRKLYLNFRNNLILLRKNLPAKLARRVMTVRMILDGVAAVQYLVRGKPSFFAAVIKAHLSFYRIWKMEYRDYRRPETGNPAEYRGWFNGSLVVSFYLKGIRKFRDLSL